MKCYPMLSELLVSMSVAIAISKQFQMLYVAK